MGRVIGAIDPGDDTGWSKFLDRRLSLCGLAHPVDYVELPFRMGLPVEPLDLVIELPQDYGSNRQVDPNNLVSLGYKVGAIYGVFSAYYHLLGKKLDRTLVHPNEWKGQVPKPIHHDRELAKLDRGERAILQTALERVPKGKRHDVKDAVCLGLWRAKR